MTTNLEILKQNPNTVFEMIHVFKFQFYYAEEMNRIFYRCLIMEGNWTEWDAMTPETITYIENGELTNIGLQKLVPNGDCGKWFKEVIRNKENTIVKWMMDESRGWASPDQVREFLRNLYGQ